MPEHNTKIQQLLSDPMFKQLLQSGLIDCIALRNLIIKDEYIELRVKNSQSESIYLLSRKYNLSTDAINSILFRKRILKPVDFQKIYHQ